MPELCDHTSPPLQLGLSYSTPIVLLAFPHKNTVLLSGLLLAPYKACIVVVMGSGNHNQVTTAPDTRDDSP